MALSRPLTVLIADDSESVSDMLVELVSSPGLIEVIAVSDSEPETIEKIMRLRPDVVILDMQLRLGHGAGVIRAIRASSALAQTKLIVMTNHVSPQARQHCLDAGADYFLDKSKDFDRLLATLNGFLT